MIFDPQVFVVYLVYSSSVFIAAYMFVGAKRRRARAALRFVSVLAALVALSALLTLSEPWQSSALGTDAINYTVLSMLSLFSILFLCKEPFWKIFYCMNAGVFARQCYSKLVVPFAMLFGIGSGELLYQLLHVALAAVVYTLIYFTLARRVAADDTFAPDKNILVFTFILTFLMFASYLEPVLSAVDKNVLALFCVCEAAAYFLVLFVFYYFFNYARRLARTQTESRMRAERLRQLDNFQTVVDVMNVKFHDMKYRLAQKDAAPGDAERALAAYGLFVRSGNELLDTVLTERNVYLRGKGITLTCAIDGSAFAFLAADDLCALFGNALDNAAEYLGTLEDADKKFVRVTGVRSGGLTVLRFENYFEGSVTFSRDGLPQTTKANKDYHGFGVRSVRRIAEKYGGSAVFKAEDGLFKAHILFPSR